MYSIQILMNSITRPTNIMYIIYLYLYVHILNSFRILVSLNIARYYNYNKSKATWPLSTIHTIQTNKKSIVAIVIFI